jgi:large-conductance mechanosensitive channel
MASILQNVFTFLTILSFIFILVKEFPATKKSLGSDTSTTQQMRQQRTYRIQDSEIRITGTLIHQYRIPHTSYRSVIQQRN